MTGTRITADDRLTTLASVPQAKREEWLNNLTVKQLRAMVDLCCVDATDMPKRMCIKAIIRYF